MSLHSVFVLYLVRFAGLMCRRDAVHSVLVTLLGAVTLLAGETNHYIARTDPVLASDTAR